MRWLFFWALGVMFPGLILPVTADDGSAANVVQEFSGGGTTTTGFFQAQDRWEVRWNAKQVVSVAVMSKDGAIVAGAAGVLRGSLFVPLGGQYYLKVSDGTVPPPAPTPAPPPAAPAPDTSTNVVALTNEAPATNAPPAALTNGAPTTNAAPASATNAPPMAATNAGPVATTNAPAADTNAASAATTNVVPIDLTPPPAPIEVTWHLQVVQLGASSSADQALTVYTPYFAVPDSAATPVAPVVVPPPPVLSDDEAHAVVSIKGDNAQGAGFLMRSPEGTFVVTHLHLLAANPNVKLFTSSGEPITVLGLQGAVDRDVAMFTIQDNHYSYLPAPSETANDALAGDQLIIPDIGEQLDIATGKPGRLIGMSPERIDFDNAMDQGSAGAPVIHVKSGAVLGIVTTQKRVDVSDRLAQAWTANPAPGSSAIIPYFGLRLTGMQGWEKYDLDRFQQETLFLRQFHENTRYLDSYLNGRRDRGEFGDVENENGPPDSRYFLKCLVLRKDQDTYRQQASGADQDQRLDATRELLFDLQGFAGTDLETLQGQKGLYGYDQAWAQEEIAYRLALKKEIDELGNNIVRLDNLARSR